MTLLLTDEAYCSVGCWSQIKVHIDFVNLFHAEHFCHIEGEHGLVHAKPLQQQNLVRSIYACSPQMQPENFSFHLGLTPIFEALFFFFSLRFIIELCEPIQVKQLDIANFELFSSTPKDFLVSISDRYSMQSS